MDRFTNRAAATLVAAAFALGAGAGSPAQASNGPTVQAACTQATIVGQSKCIAAGQFCKHTSRANRDYHRYGYHCGKQDRRGNYHLQYR